jgi:hypothetical protein
MRHFHLIRSTVGLTKGQAICGAIALCCKD